MTSAISKSTFSLHFFMRKMASASHMTCSIRYFTCVFVVNVIYKKICVNNIKFGACRLYLWALLYRATLIGTILQNLWYPRTETNQCFQCYKKRMARFSWRDSKNVEPSSLLLLKNLSFRRERWVQVQFYTNKLRRKRKCHSSKAEKLLASMQVTCPNYVFFCPA